MPKFVVFWLPSDNEGVYKKELLVSDALGRNFTVSSVRLLPGSLGLPLHGAFLVLIARQVDMQDPALIMALLSSSSCVPLDALLKSVDMATVHAWPMLVESRRTSRRCDTFGVGVDFDKLYKDLAAAGLAPPAHPEMTHFDSTIFGYDIHSSLSTPEQCRAVQLVGWMRHRDEMAGVVDLNDTKGPVHLDASLPGTHGTKLYMDLAAGTSTVMNPYHVLAAKGYDPNAYNLSVMPSRLANTMAENAVPMNVVIAFLLTCQKLIGPQ
jgi:hypothetical protein